MNLGKSTVANGISAFIVSIGMLFLGSYIADSENRKSFFLAIFIICIAIAGIIQTIAYIYNLLRNIQKLTKELENVNKNRNGLIDERKNYQKIIANLTDKNKLLMTLIEQIAPSISQEQRELMLFLKKIHEN